MCESRSGGTLRTASGTEARHDAMEGGEVEGGRLPDYLQWWGKAQPADPVSPAFHPIGYHSLDVAAVVRALLRSRPGAVRRASRLLRAPHDEAIALCAGRAPLQDLGTVRNALQAKVPVLVGNPSIDGATAGRVMRACGRALSDPNATLRRAVLRQDCTASRARTARARHDSRMPGISPPAEHDSTISMR